MAMDSVNLLLPGFQGHELRASVLGQVSVLISRTIFANIESECRCYSV